MARSGPGVPKPLRPLVGGAALVAGVRIVDALWRRIAGRPTPTETRAADDGRAGEPAVVRDRLAYALLLGAALRLARRAGLSKKDAGRTDGGANGRSPA